MRLLCSSYFDAVFLLLSYTTSELHPNSIMTIGIPKEIKPFESRVSLTPSGVRLLVAFGHHVLVESSAGEGSGFSDSEYRSEGAQICESPDRVWANADLILKVKEPIEVEYKRMRRGQILFTYFHFAAEEALFCAIRDSGVVAIAYETVSREDGTLPLLVPMSEVAGRLAPQEGAKCLAKPAGGRGVLMGGIPGVAPAKVLILGAGVVGVNAAHVAAGMGAEVLLLDNNLHRLRLLEETLPDRVRTRFSTPETIRELLPGTDMVIGAILQPGARADRLVTREMLGLMRKGTVLVDVAIDQGGCFETSRPTTHQVPTFVVDGVVHYCVSNMPGAVPVTATLGLTNATMPYIVQLANLGWMQAIHTNRELRGGLSLAQGLVLNERIAETYAVECASLEELVS